MNHISKLLVAFVVLAGCGRGEDVTTSETVQGLAVNGSFETANYAGWTLLETPPSPTSGTYGIASNGQTIQPGEAVFDFFDNLLVSEGSPGLPITYVATDGAFVALQLVNGPQNHRMFQDLTLPACQPLLLWDMFYRNHNADFDPTGQFIAVNIRNTSDGVLATPFKTNPGDPLVLPGMTPFQVDLSAFSGQTIRIDFEHQVQLFFFDAAWDNIRVICKGLSASPGTLDFGSIAVGATSTRTTTVTNFAATPLTISSAPVSGPFTITNGPPLPITIPPGGITAFELTFQPAVVGPVAGTLTLNSDDPNGATVVALSGSGLDGARLTPSVPFLGFPDTQVGEVSAPQTLGLQNTGTSLLSLSSVVVGGDFLLDTTGMATTLAPGVTTSITVRFAPTSPTPSSATISIVSNDPGSPTLVAVAGNGIAPQLALAPAALAFGAHRVGTTSIAELVRARNDGIGPLTISAATVTGPFARSAVGFPITLAPGQFIDLDVTFSPTVAGAAAGQLSFTSSAPTSPDVVALSGTGIEPLIDASPPSVSFGDQRVATTGARSIVVSNPGTATLTISSITSSSGVFANTDPVPIILAPGASATLGVSFTPPAATNFAGTLTIQSDAAASPTIVPLSGRGVEPIASVDPSSLVFANRRVGTTSPTKPVTLTNTGTSALTIASISVAPPFLATAPATPFVLAPGTSATVQVRFAPTAAGLASSALTIISDAAASPTVVPCSGTGIEPVISASTVSLAFGNVRTGTTSTGQTITLTNVGTASLLISAATAPPSFTLTSPPLPRSVLPGASATFTVKFAPTADGPAGGNVVITSDAASSPTVVAVAGTGVSPAIAVSPASHDFGDVLAGSTSAPVGVSIQNPGTDPLTVTAVTVAAPFARGPITLPATVAPGGSLAFDVTFAPTTRSLAIGAVVIASDAGAASVGLTGRGVAPLIAASLDPVDFGTVAIATTSTLVLELSNPGDAPLAISTLAFSGTGAGDFAFTSAPALPAILAPGASLVLSIDFTPSDHGARTAQLIASSDALGTPALAVGLVGAGAGPRVALDPPALDFGPANVTVTTAPRSVEISNTGESPLVVSSIVLGGANAADFAVTASLPLTLAPGEASDVELTFTASAVGARTATATVVTTDPLAPTAVVTLAGTGESPVLAVSPAALPFGEVRVGQSKVLPFTVTNTGTGPLTITTFALAGPDAAQLALAPVTLPLVLAPSASRVVSVTFSPTILGSVAATIDLLSDDPVTGTVAVPVTGTGVSPTVALAPSDLDFGGQLVGRLSAPRQLHIQNTGSGPLSVVSLALTGAQASSFTFVSPPALPTSIAAGGELVLSLRVTPTAIGALAADLAIGTDSPDAPTASAGLAALGISTAMSLTPTTIDFGTAHVPAQGAPVAVTLANLTGDTLTLVDAVLGGARPNDFAVTSVAGALPAGGSITAMVSYTATVAATSAATLTFRTTDSTVPQGLVTLSGKAVSTFLTVDRGELDFGAIQIGDRSGPRSITVTNVTTAPITIASIVALDAQFVVDGAAALAPIPPGGNATFTVTFEPTADAVTPSQVLVTLQGSTAPELSIAVTGEGTASSSGGCSATHGSSFGLLLLLVALVLRRRR